MKKMTKREREIIDDRIRLAKKGYVEAPAWMPVPHPDYVWQFPGNIYAMMYPSPTIWHCIRYGFLSAFVPVWYRRWQLRRILRKRISAYN